jgi:hypothetical protein
VPRVPSQHRLVVGVHIRVYDGAHDWAVIPPQVLQPGLHP